MENVVKAKSNVTKEFIKAQRQIYKLISQTPHINATQMSENMGISLRQVQRYLKQLSDLNLIVRDGGRKMVFGKSWMMNTKASSKEYKIQIAGNISLLIRAIICYFNKSYYLLLYYKKVTCVITFCFLICALCHWILVKVCWLCCPCKQPFQAFHGVCE